MPNSGIAATARIPVATSRLATGRAMTRRATMAQKPWVRSTSCWRRRNRTGTRSAFTRSPMTASSAGSSVSEAATATSTTTIAPAAMLRKIVVGFSSIPASASTTVIPEKNTARLAVAPAALMAASLSRPRARSSR